MRILLVGAGGVGGAFAAIAARRDFFETIVVADYDLARAEKAAATDAPVRCRAGRRVDADSVAALCREHGITHVMNAVDPRFVMPIFDGAFAGRCRLPGHGHEPVAAAPDGAVLRVRRQAR